MTCGHLFTGVFWIKNIWPPDTFLVEVNGQERTDYEEIRRVKDGQLGIVMHGLTYDELCNIAIHCVPRPLSTLKEE